MRLALPSDMLGDAYDAIVVGSGAGGAVAASRLARMGLSVALIERGREIAPGFFPDSLAEARRELALTTPQARSGRPDALYQVHAGLGARVLSASALGGTTLLGAGIALAPDPRVWEDPCWPQELLADGLLEEGFSRARTMLRPAPWPGTRPLDKLARLVEAAGRLGAAVERPPAAIALSAGHNAVGLPQAACTLCGDCAAGCNVGARTTARETWIADAVLHGARVFTGVEARHVARSASGWQVHWRPIDLAVAPRAGQGSPPPLAARLVLLAAGSLGSTELLLRSAANGLQVSARLGAGVSLNGGHAAVAWHGQKVVSGIGIGVPPRVDTTAPGPATAGIIRLGTDDRLEEGLLIAECTLPSALAEALPAVLAEGARRHGRRTSSGVLDSFQEAIGRADSSRLGPWAGAMARTQAYLVSAHDAAAGCIALTGDQAVLTWSGPPDDPTASRIDSRLVEATTANDGTYLADPLSVTVLGGGPVAFEPLGGAAMGRDRTAGVVDHSGRVFDAAGAELTAVHEGLYVVDAAVIARPLGVPPMLTVAALAERAMMLLSASLGRQLTAAPPPREAASTLLGARPEPSGAVLRERLEGWISDRGEADHAEAAAAGRSSGHALTVELVLHAEDASSLAPSSEAEIRISGLVSSPALADVPLQIETGTLRRASSGAGAALVASMRLGCTDGRAFAFGCRRIVPDRGRPDRMVDDAATLACDIVEQQGLQRRWRGVARMDAASLARTLAAIEPVGGSSRAERLSAVAALGRMVAGPLYDLHGSVDPGRRTGFGSPAPAAAPRKRRGLRTGTAALHWFRAGDGTWLRLVRYDADGSSRKGPVLLVHGLATSSRVFALDTVDTSLVEHLCDRGFDCWMLDHRASADLDSSRAAFTVDDIARHDIRPAIELVRRVTGAPSVQLVAHCLGALAATMAVLGGHAAGIRSAVLMQVAGDLVPAGARQRVAATLRVASLLERLCRPDGRSRASGRAVLALARMAASRATRQASVPGAEGFFGELAELAQLDPLTRDVGLPSLLGAASTTAIAHLALMLRRGQAVDARGENVYLPHLERLAVPITFVHGALNGCFAPDSTLRTYEKLVARNGARLYERHLVPNYGHLDCLIGRNAAVDVFQKIHEHLERTINP